ncbi:MAG TPA: hypothetical protein PLC42_04755 [Parachlamydiaceae bacterium]|nr:hypothetical protein [Parachlamydiaceae bacterium]
MDFFKNIQKDKMFALLIGTAFLPLLFSLFHFMTEKARLDELQSNLNDTEYLSSMREKKQSVNMALRSHNKDADHFYIDKHLETLTFLEHEIDHLDKIINNENFAEDEAIKKRFEFLTGSLNSMIFSEGVVQSHPLFQETTETLVHPVEVNILNIQQILSHIEGTEVGAFSPPPHRPQLIVLDFKLDKKSLNEKNDVFLLNLKLLKREFL